jgi:predicted nuclease of predicted toxin-antitoxin system
MKLKLDENLGVSAKAALTSAGFEAETVRDEELEGTGDRDLIAHCAREERCLVTMDVEFGNPLLYPPHEHRGIVLLRLPARSDRSAILQAIETFCDALRASLSPDRDERMPGPDRHLWVVQPGRVRLYQGDQDAN